MFLGVNHLVPVFFPEDTIEGMKLLTKSEVRKEAGVSNKNIYVFASGQNSDKHFSGWHSLTNTCEKLPIQEKSRLTGTTNRHRLSTLLAGLNLTDLERDMVYKHFGHSKDMNEKVYQAPAGNIQLATTGSYLAEIDKGILSFLYFCSIP